MPPHQPRTDLSTPLHKYGDAPRASMRYARKARDCDVLAEYVAGNGTRLIARREAVLRGGEADAASSIEYPVSIELETGWMQQRSNASVFMKRGA